MRIREHAPGLLALAALLTPALAPPAPRAQSCRTATAVAAAARVSVAVRDDGTVHRWGERPIRETDPVARPVASLAEIVDVECAGNDSCVALDVDGVAWSFSGFGSSEPERAVGVPPLVRAVRNVFGVFGLDGGGALWAWSPSGAAPVAGLPPIAELAAAGAHVLALAVDGRVFAQGANSAGQLGQGHADPVDGFVEVALTRPAVAVGAGPGVSVVALDDGSVHAWGSNASLLLAAPDVDFVSSPVDLGAPVAMGRVDASAASFFALAADDSLWSVGHDAFGELGTDTRQRRSTWDQVPLTGVGEFAAGQAHVVALPGDGSVAAWGSNNRGELGLDPRLFSQTPVPVLDLSDVVSFTDSWTNSAAVLGDGTAWGWGRNLDGQLGQRDNVPGARRPAPVEPAASFVQVDQGDWSTAWRAADGTVWMAGYNRDGQLGVGLAAARVDVPTLVPGIATAIDIAHGTSHVLALLADGTLRAWGGNADGELGDGTRESREAPVTVVGLDGVVDVEAAYHFSAALRSDGTVWTWGSNEGAKLGHSSGFDSLLATPVPGISDAVEIALGDYHVLVRRADGTLLAWGWGAEGQLGTGDGEGSLTPVPVPGLTDVQSIAAGVNTSFAWTSDGTAWSWGSNRFGVAAQDPAIEDVLSPTALPPTGWVDVDVGIGGATALLADGTLESWGDDSHGELGRDNDIWSQVPLAPDFTQEAVGVGDSLRVRKGPDDEAILEWTSGWNASRHEVRRDEMRTFAGPTLVAQPVPARWDDPQDAAPRFYYRVGALDCDGVPIP